MIRIAIVDDHPIVRDGIRSILETQPDLEVVAAAETEAQLQTNAKPDAIVLDWELQGGRGGAATIKALHARMPDARIVIFSAYAGEDRVGAALSSGAKGYVLKGSPASELITAIRSIAAGGTYLGTGVAAPMLSPREELTKRELEVLQAAAAGLSNDEISAKLGISARTVKFHMTSIFGRLGASRRAQAVAIAKERGLF